MGGRIVGEVFVGLMLADKQSVLNAQKPFKPRKEFFSSTGEFNMPDLLRQAMKA